MDSSPLPSKAAAAVRLYEDRLHRAQREYDAAAKALVDARTALDAAELAHEAARHVFQAGEADRARELGFDKLAPSTRAWLRALADYDLFGMAEARDAAAAVGLTLSDDAIRQHMTRHNAKGVFVQAGRGAYRVSGRARSELAAMQAPLDAATAPDGGSTPPSGGSGNLFTDRDAADHGHDARAPDPSAQSESQPPSGTGRPAGPEGEFDYRDDDSPF